MDRTHLFELLLICFVAKVDIDNIYCREIMRIHLVKDTLTNKASQMRNIKPIKRFFKSQLADLQQCFLKVHRPVSNKPINKYQPFY